MMALEQLWRRLRGMAGSAVGYFVDDSGPLQVVQVKPGPFEIVGDKTPRLGEFGLASNPPRGFIAGMIFISGNRSNGIMFGVEHPDYRLKNLPEGASALYDSLGQYIALLPTGIYVVCPAGMVLTGPITASDVSDSVGSLAELRAQVAALQAAYDVHTHGVTGSTTTPPTPTV